MPPATARSCAFPTPHAGTAFRTRRPARNALLAAYVVPSAIVAATVVGSYRRREAFYCGSVRSRPDRRRQRRPGGKNAHREESKSCIECLHKRTPFRFRQWIRATTACTWRSLRMWVSAFVVRLGKYSFVHRSPDAGPGRFGRSGRSELVRINDWKRLRAGLPHDDGRTMVVDCALAYAEICGDVLA
jgi:hypothetical protein